MRKTFPQYFPPWLPVHNSMQESSHAEVLHNIELHNIDNYHYRYLT